MTPTTITTMTEALAAEGHVVSRSTAAAVVGALGSRRLPGARALLLEGPPGVGKSSLAAAVGRVLDAPIVARQLHAWTDADELFVGVDVAAAVAGDAERVAKPGVLAQVATMSLQHPWTVLLLDEVDKAPERAEALLLDWLQTGRCPDGPTADLDKILVILSSNAARPLSDALLRRVRVTEIAPLPIEDVARLAADWTGLPEQVQGAVVRAMAGASDHVVSPQEAARCAVELVEVCETYADAGATFGAWVRSNARLPTEVWEIIVRHRRGLL